MLRLFIARKSCLCGLCPWATCLIQSYLMISIKIRMYSIVYALLYLFVTILAKPPHWRFDFQKNLLRRLKKLILVAFSSSNIVEIWAHWKCMAVERKYEYHLYPIWGRLHRDSTSIGQVKYFYHYAFSSIMFLDCYCLVWTWKLKNMKRLYIFSLDLFNFNY